MNQSIEEQQKLKEIADRFKKEFEENRQKMIDDYRKEFINHLTPDKALYLCKEYKDTPELRIKLDSELRDTANKIKNAVWDEIIKEAPEKNMVAFITSGSGSGKSSLIENEELKPFMENTDAINDVIKGLSENRIEEALKSGRDVAIIYVHRPIEKATEGIVERAEKGGHITDLKYHSEGHFEIQNKFLDLAGKYKDNPRVHFGIVDNSGKENEVKFVGDREKAIETVKNNAYSSIEEVKERAFRSYENVRGQREKQGEPLGENIRTALFPSGEREFQEISENRRTLRGEREETSRIGQSGIRGVLEEKGGSEAEKRGIVSQPSEDVSDKSQGIKPTRIFTSNEFNVDKISDSQIQVNLPKGESAVMNLSQKEFQDKFGISLHSKNFRESMAKTIEETESGETGTIKKDQKQKSGIIDPLSIQIETQITNQAIKNTQSQ